MSLIKTLLKESRGEFKYQSDYIRYLYLKDIKESSKEESPDYNKLIDGYDGYDDLTYLQNIDDKTFIYYEGWNNECWKGAYSKPEYKNLSKEEIMEDLVTNRMSIVLNKLNYKMVDYEHIRYKRTYITKITITI